MKLALNIAAMLIAFLALLALINALLGWVGGLVGLPQLSLEWLFSLVLAPVAWLMGVPWADCGEVAVLLGKKTVLNEFIAYLDLKGLIEKRKFQNGQQSSQPTPSVALLTLARLAFKLVELVELHPNVRKIWHS